MNDNTQITKLCKRCQRVTPVAPNGQCRPCATADKRTWRLENPDRQKDAHALYMLKARKRIPDKLRAKRRRSYERRKHLQMIQASEYAAWLKSGDATNAQLKAIADAHGRKCRYCGVPVRVKCSHHHPAGFDHVVSKFRGGTHTASNIVVCCGKCNSSKGKLSLKEWQEQKQYHAELLLASAMRKDGHE